jgi:hypothetical protein
MALPSKRGSVLVDMVAVIAMAAGDNGDDGYNDKFIKIYCCC